MNQAKEVDIYRDTPVRYLGYANEVGEAFRSLVHKSLVHSTYVVAFGYVLADGFSKSFQKNSDPARSDKPNRLILFSDAVLWQSFASVIIPGFTINRLCAFCSFSLRHSLKNTSSLRRKWLCTAIGLAAIPFIIHPIDKAVDYVMDNSIRKCYTNAGSKVVSAQK